MFRQIVGCVFILLLVLTGGCAPLPDDATLPGGDTLTGNAAKEGFDVDSLNRAGVTIAVEAGTPGETAVMETFPRAERLYVDSSTEGVLAVRAGAADALAADETNLGFIVRREPEGVRVVEADLGDETDIAIGISPVTEIEGLQDDINAFLEEIRANGTFDEMFERWMIRKETAMPVIEAPKNPAFTLKVGTTGLFEPYSFYAGDQLVGMDIEMAYRLAAYLGAEVDFWLYGWDEVVAAAQAGETDCVMTALFATEERREQIDFSHAVYTSKTVLLLPEATP